MTTEAQQFNSNSFLISPAIPDHFSAKNSPLKLGILASGSGSNFEAIMEAINNQKLNAQAQVMIYNNPGAKVRDRAEKWGVPAILLNHREYKNREKFDGKIVETLQEYDVEWVIMAGWMRIVTKVLIDAFPNQVINIHPSLLPSFRGIKAIEQALEAGVKITGCTVHLVDVEVDNGPILMQAAVPILPDDTPETLHERVQIQEHQIIVGAITLAAST
ncbi:MAG: phosphoribosylglycinamide formyltransferase [Okeania sp. SIO2G4]|uniref:phosphoribosylglycinamide formyltransferase n=1 Tax=unclassified Okeania TaxID=2634635 RepID=UPI0013B9EF68|nr:MULTISPECIES: phosphoribosylglycinamide formyltransferase [unclassified Okeania]NEP07828.1 phosphoribosylglycinamide formyltransferase [Okeania sp. SIO4D6]NEP41642.1 phosphoribosylglycinamide formyltransferase [Okeania sp. SIO2H7]NEP75231.1 phosphoribosylglycinamide formyltransferase [Okeania sp. SIO2G5]NEP96312.1 phosphoribosylglycinamide formyltransferase [Okeania sp. SIO2F5]NEQ94026.1 phosphoribosylglycinamide formyltransferase [Okeania sp. SIO2G4]